MTPSSAPGTLLLAPPSTRESSPSLAAVLTFPIGNGIWLGARAELGALDVFAEVVPELIKVLPMRTTRLGRESPPLRDQPGRRRKRTSASVVGPSAPSMWKAGSGSSAEVDPVRAKESAVLRVRGMKKPSLPNGMERP